MTYALFSGDHYYPDGGWDDFQGAYATISEAKAAREPSDFKWAHIVDLDARKIVARCDDLHPWRDLGDAR